MASSLNTPDVLTQPIAENGDKNIIPSTNDQSLGQMSQSTGFPAICSERIADGGKAPRRADFNGAFNMLSRYMFFKQNGGIETFRADVSTAIGGYPKDAILGYRTTTEFKLVRSLIANNTYNFNTTPSYIDDGTHWESVIPMSKNIANWSSNASNCIIEIPQDINLTLSAGTLTLKAGSKFYVPQQDGSFAENTVSTDINISGGWGSINEQQFLIRLVGGSWTVFPIRYCQSGDSADSTRIRNDGFGIWYDTANHIIKWTVDSGNTWSGGCSLPVAIVTETTSSNLVTKIDQVFNGFGYIGSTIFVLPGVKIAIPDDRNTDGTLKNRIETVPAVRTTNKIHTSAYMLNAAGITPASNISYAEQTTQPSFANGNWYNPENNTMYSISSGVATKINQMCCLHIISSTGSYGGTIVSFSPKLPFRAVDYSDTEFIAHQAMPSDKKLSLTVGVTGTQYTANSDGYFTFSVTPTASNLPCNSTVVIKSSSGTEKYRKVNTVYGAGTSAYYIAPVSKGDIFKLEGLDYGTWQTVEFVYANGSK